MIAIINNADCLTTDQLVSKSVQAAQLVGIAESFCLHLQEAVQAVVPDGQLLRTLTPTTDQLLSALELVAVRFENDEISLTDFKDVILDLAYFPNASELWLHRILRMIDPISEELLPFVCSLCGDEDIPLSVWKELEEVGVKLPFHRSCLENSDEILDRLPSLLPFAMKAIGGPVNNAALKVVRFAAPISLAHIRELFEKLADNLNSGEVNSSLLYDTLIFLLIRIRNENNLECLSKTFWFLWTERRSECNNRRLLADGCLTDWFPDELGFPPISHHHWMFLSKKNVNSLFPWVASNSEPSQAQKQSFEKVSIRKKTKADDATTLWRTGAGDQTIDLKLPSMNPLIDGYSIAVLFGTRNHQILKHPVLRELVEFRQSSYAFTNSLSRIMFDFATKSHQHWQLRDVLRAAVYISGGEHYDMDQMLSSLYQDARFRRLLERQIFDRTKREDLLQEAMLRISKMDFGLAFKGAWADGRHSFESKVTAYFKRIFTNALIDDHRKENRTPDATSLDDTCLVKNDASLRQLSNIELVNFLIGRFCSADEAVTIQLLFFEGRSASEVARLLKISKTAVNNRKNKFLKNAKRWLTSVH